MKDFYTYKGAIHIHTMLSDGTGDIDMISKAAKKAGLDFIIITDHNYYDTDEGVINGVYVIKAQEISPIQSNHYIALDVNKTILPKDDTKIYVDEVRKLGGFGFSAHPDEGFIVNEKGNVIPRKNSNHCIPWTDKNVIPDGIEIWNWFSNWADNLDDTNILSLAYAFIFKHNIITPPSKITTAWWDKLNNEKETIIPAIGGVDAHALKIKKYIIPVTVFPYETCFKTITNIIKLNKKLSSDFTLAKKQILKAIKSGNNIILNRHTVAEIPNIYAKNNSGEYYCGEDIILDNNTSLHFLANNIFEICLIYNGSTINKVKTNNYCYKINEAGKYRLEVSYRGRGFLYTNPFNIKVEPNGKNS